MSSGSLRRQVLILYKQIVEESSLLYYLRLIYEDERLHLITKQMLYMGREWPQGYNVFKDRAKQVFSKNSTETDPVKISALIDRGNFVLKEMEALYKLKKYRTLKKRYYQ